MPSGLASRLPHTSKLLDVRYLLGAAILSRLAVGLSRCIVDFPWSAAGRLRAAKNEPISPGSEETVSDRFKSFEERCFMEMLGTPVHVLSLQLTQDGVSKLLEKTPWLKAPHIEQVKKLANLSGPEAEVIGQALKEINPTHVLARAIYKPKELTGQLNQVMAKTLEGFQSQLGKKSIPKAVEQAVSKTIWGWQQRILGGSALCLMSGVLASALFSGIIWQRINDGILSKRVIPFFNRLMGMNRPTFESLPDQALDSAEMFGGGGGTSAATPKPGTLEDAFRPTYESTIPVVPGVNRGEMATLPLPQGGLWPAGVHGSYGSGWSTAPAAPVTYQPPLFQGRQYSSQQPWPPVRTTVKPGVGRLWPW